MPRNYWSAGVSGVACTGSPGRRRVPPCLAPTMPCSVAENLGPLFVTSLQRQAEPQELVRTARCLGRAQARTMPRRADGFYQRFVDSALLKERAGKGIQAIPL
jgi:hypothetical protein